MAINRRIVFDDVEISSPPDHYEEYCTRGDEPVGIAVTRVRINCSICGAYVGQVAFASALVALAVCDRCNSDMNERLKEHKPPLVPTKPRDALEDPRLNAQFAKLKDLRDGLNPFEDD